MDRVSGQPHVTAALDHAARSLENLEGFLRVIRIPRADVLAMIEQAPPETAGLLATRDSVADALAAHGWLTFPGAPRRQYCEAAAITDRRPQAQLDPELTSSAINGALVATWNADADRLDAIVGGVERIYAAPANGADLRGLREGRVAMVQEALANHRDGRHASAIALAITQIDGIAADVPPTPNAAFPFLVADPRDRTKPDLIVDAASLAAHPGCVTLVARLMRTGRPDTNVGAGLHRHGIMHGRDLAYGTQVNSTKVLTVLLALVQWAEPVARARVAAT